VILSKQKYFLDCWELLLAIMEELLFFFLPHLCQNQLYSLMQTARNQREIRVLIYRQGPQIKHDQGSRTSGYGLEWDDSGPWVGCVMVAKIAEWLEFVWLPVCVWRPSVSRFSYPLALGGGGGEAPSGVGDEVSPSSLLGGCVCLLG
jgi:hypothetical protein